MNVLVKFWFIQWDNHQGASGKIINQEKIMEIAPDTPISQIKEQIIRRLHGKNYYDSLFKEEFSGHGIVSISIF